MEYLRAARNTTYLLADFKELKNSIFYVFFQNLIQPWAWAY